MCQMEETGLKLINTTVHDLSNMTDYLLSQKNSIGVTLLLIASISFVTNGLIVVVYIKSRSLRTTHDLLLMILSLLSMYVAVSLPFYVAYFAFPEYVIANKLPCLMFANIMQSGKVTSSLTLAALGLERYFYVTRPSSILRTPVKWICAFYIFFFSTCSFFFFMPSLGFNYWETYRVCVPAVFPKMFYITQQTLTVSALVITTSCHLWLLRITLKYLKKADGANGRVIRLEQHRKPKTNQLSNKSLVLNQRERKAVVTVGSILLVYMVLCFPYVILSIILFNDFDMQLEIWRQRSLCLLMTNSFASPVIYAISNRRFLRRATALFCKRDIYQS